MRCHDSLHACIPVKNLLTRPHTALPASQTPNAQFFFMKTKQLDGIDHLANFKQCKANA